jgi:uncharacterized phage protein (TIGR02216 family)
VTPVLRVLLGQILAGPVSEFADACGAAGGALRGAALGWTPDAFWRATPAELAAVVTAAGGGGAAAVTPPDATTIAAMRRADPDG